MKPHGKLLARGTRGARGAHERAQGGRRARGDSQLDMSSDDERFEAWAAETRGGPKCPPSMRDGLRAVYKEDAFTFFSSIVTIGGDTDVTATRVLWDTDELFAKKGAEAPATPEQDGNLLALRGGRQDRASGG